MRKAWPTAQLVHLPVHASWLDQAEIFFSILQRKVLTPNDLTDLDALTERILAFQDRYNATATPFDWTFTPHRPRPAPRPHRRPRGRRPYPEHGVGHHLMTPTCTFRRGPFRARVKISPVYSGVSLPGRTPP